MLIFHPAVSILSLISGLHFLTYPGPKFWSPVQFTLKLSQPFPEKMLLINNRGYCAFLKHTGCTAGKVRKKGNYLPFCGHGSNWRSQASSLGQQEVCMQQFHACIQLWSILFPLPFWQVIRLLYILDTFLSSDIRQHRGTVVNSNPYRQKAPQRGAGAGGSLLLQYISKYSPGACRMPW